MNVVYCSSNEYCEYTGISIISLLENNRKMKDLNIYIIDTGISEENIFRIKQIEKMYNRKIYMINCEKELNSIKNKVPSFNGSFSPYAKILFDVIFPNEIKQILYIDSDTIINGNISYFEHIDMSGKLIAAVKNPGAYIDELNEEEKKIVEKNKFYFNSGVMYLNLEYWRRINFSQIVYEKVKQLKKMTFVDQTILNASISEDLYKNIPYKYNYWGHQWTNVTRKRIHKLYEKYFSIKEIEEACKEPIIIHFKGILTRPWYIESTSSEQSKYLYYKSLSPWCNVPLKTFFEDTYFKKLSMSKKIRLRTSVIIRKLIKLLH